MTAYHSLSYNTTTHNLSQPSVLTTVHSLLQYTAYRRGQYTVDGMGGKCTVIIQTGPGHILEDIEVIELEHCVGVCVCVYVSLL